MTQLIGSRKSVEGHESGNALFLAQPLVFFIYFILFTSKTVWSTVLKFCMILYFIILWSNSSNMSITVVCKVLVIKTTFLDFLWHFRNYAQITILINLSAVKMPTTIMRSQHLVQPNWISNYWDADSESYYNLAK